MKVNLKVLKKYDFECACFRIIVEFPSGERFDLGTRRGVTALKEFMAKIHGYPIRYDIVNSEPFCGDDIESAVEFVESLVRNVELDVEKVKQLVSQEIEKSVSIDIPMTTDLSALYALISRCVQLINSLKPMQVSEAEELVSTAKKTLDPDLTRKTANLLHKIRGSMGEWDDGQREMLKDILMTAKRKFDGC